MPDTAAPHYRNPRRVTGPEGFRSCTTLGSRRRNGPIIGSRDAGRAQDAGRKNKSWCRRCKDFRRRQRECLRRRRSGRAHRSLRRPRLNLIKQIKPAIRPWHHRDRHNRAPWPRALAAAPLAPSASGRVQPRNRPRSSCPAGSSRGWQHFITRSADPAERPRVRWTAERDRLQVMTPRPLRTVRTLAAKIPGVSPDRRRQA